MVEKEAQAIAMWEEAVKDRESFPYFIRLLDAMVVESLLEWAAEECKEYADVLWRGRWVSCSTRFRFAIVVAPENTERFCWSFF